MSRTNSLHPPLLWTVEMKPSNVRAPLSRDWCDRRAAIETIATRQWWSSEKRVSVLKARMTRCMRERRQIGQHLLQPELRDIAGQTADLEQNAAARRQLDLAAERHVLVGELALVQRRVVDGTMIERSPTIGRRLVEVLEDQPQQQRVEVARQLGVFVG